ncbi:carbonic anhydrase 9-like [Penaeus monodon]|uniref:carbonic anhydrase 9-like n=1 Tax=Penaeus monodon TaxID=6687 RepID=UPI0018A7173C|nr:carbonic anhydrase 9-like [Penaeus monodon]
MGGGFPDCAGRSQSPVEHLGAKDLINVSLENKPGDSLKANLHPPEETATPSARGRRPLGQTFELDSFHFHWGDEDSKGSEHLLGAARFPPRCLVHFKRKYGSLKNALQF